jgi:hypothetical protein
MGNLGKVPRQAYRFDRFCFLKRLVKRRASADCKSGDNDQELRFHTASYSNAQNASSTTLFIGGGAFSQDGCAILKARRTECRVIID